MVIFQAKPQFKLLTDVVPSFVSGEFLDTILTEPILILLVSSEVPAGCDSSQAFSASRQVIADLYQAYMNRARARRHIHTHTIIHRSI